MAQFKRNDRYSTRLTPNVELSEGVRPAHLNVAASYLPLKRFDSKLEAWKVISAGKVLAFDSNGYTVPAGLALDIEKALSSSTAYNSKAEFIAASADFANLYTQYDVDNGIKNSAGTLVVVNEPVVASFFTAYDSTQTQLIFVGNPVGIAMYDFWEQNGAGFDGNPADYKYANFNLQERGAIVTRYFMEYPVVADTTGLLFPNLSVFVGTPKPGDLVTFGADSNLKVFSSAITTATNNTYTDAVVNQAIDVAAGRVLGRVWSIDTNFPKDYLEKVKTWNPNISRTAADPNGVLDQAPGSATAGLPDNLTFAGISDPANAKVAYVNIVVA